MNNQIAGTITIAIVLLLLFFAFRCFQKQKFSYSLYLIIAVGALLRLFSGCDFYLHDWDEQFHALVAKNMLLHPLKPTLYENPLLPYNYKNWTGNHIWLHKPPFTFWIMALSIKIFGCNEFAIRLPSLVFSIAIIVLSYRIALQFFNQRVAIITAYLAAVNGMLIEVSVGRISSDHVELCFVFLILVAVYFLIKSFKFSLQKYSLTAIAGLICSLAILTKLLPALIVWLLFVALVIQYRIKNRKVIFINLVVLMLSSLALPLLWIIYIKLAFPIEYQNLLEAFFLPINNVVHSHNGTVFYYFTYIRIIFGEMIYLPLLFLLYFFRKDRALQLFVVWIFIPLFIFSAASTKRATYLLNSAPAYVIATAYFIDFMQITITQKYLKIGMITLFLLLPFRYMIERVKPFDNMPRRNAATIELKEYKFPKNAVLFGYPKPIEAMFFQNNLVAAYTEIPSLQITQSLTKNGYSIFLFNNNHIENIHNEK